MGYHAASQRVRRGIDAAKAERQMQKAMNEYRTDQADPRQKKKRSSRDIAREFGVDHTSLGRRVTGHRSIQEFNTTKQKCTVSEELVIVEMILESADRGRPLKHSEIRELGDLIRRKRLGDDCEKLSDSWTFAFMTRHHNRIATHFSKPLDMQRASSLNPEAVKSHFDLVKKHVVDAGVSSDRVWGMDESGFQMGYTGKETVVGARGTKTQHKAGGADRQTITAIITIRGDGEKDVPPMLIFPGQKFNRNWGNGNTARAHIARSPNGWTDRELGYQWLATVFDPATRDAANGQVRILIVDGHSSHYSVEFLHYAREHNIVVLAYPPHCTHALQGLDVVCFSRMKSCWQSEITAFEKQKNRAMTKNDFTGVWCRAYLEAFDKDTIRAAFAKTGIVPFNPDIITVQQMKPSANTSVRALFPLPMPSPVRAIMAAMSTNPPTRFDTSPSTHTRAPVAGPSRHPNSLDLNTPLTSPASTPTRKRAWDQNMDPELFTPSKRMRSLYSTLSGTSSGSILVSHEKITAHLNVWHPPVLENPPLLPAPDWSLTSSPYPTLPRSQAMVEAENERLRESLRLAQHQITARDRIIEGAHAQMVVQNLHLQKKNSALFEKEAHKNNPRTKLFNGSARWLSGDAFVADVEAIDANAKAKDQEKARKKLSREARKVQREAIEVEWKEMKRLHETAVQEWTGICEGLVAGGCRRKDLPPKPKLGKKPKLSEPADEADDNDEEEEEEGDGF